MKSTITTLFALTLLASTSVNASYTVYFPTEANSIKFVPVAEDLTQQKTPQQLCDESANKAKDLFTANYSDVSYNSHEYGTYYSDFDGTTRQACNIIYNFPYSKSFDCSGNNDEAVAVSIELSKLGFDYISINYVGECL